MDELSCERVIELLAEESAIDPPGSLDARMHALFDRAVPTVPPFRRSAVAVGLATAAFLAIVAAVGGILAQAGAAEYGPWLGFAAGSVYLALSAAAVMPLLISRKLPPRVREVSA